MSMFFLVISCNSSSKEITESKNIADKLKSWGLDSELFLDIKNNELAISILFKKDSSNSLTSYFIDEESNKMVVAMLNETFYEEFRKYNLITYNLSFEEQKDLDEMKIIIDKEMLLQTHGQFIDSPKFYDFVEYAFKHVQSVDIIRSDAWIEYLSKESKLFEFTGSFWKLLHNYSMACGRPKEKLKDIYLFIAFVGLISDPGNPKKEDINQENFKYYIESCDFDIKLIHLTLPELIKTLDEKYG